MELPFEDNSFDHVYTIEAVVHAPEKVYYLFKKKRILYCMNI
jgi:ubiquinone/menaquinone biosynthesis C-methylase UbiE